MAGKPRSYQDRHDNRKEKRPYAINPGFEAASAKGCQWIEGDPTSDDSCKCLKPALVGKSYCAEHQELSLRKDETEWQK